MIGQIYGGMIEPLSMILFIDSPSTWQANKSSEGLILEGSLIHTELAQHQSPFPLLGDEP